MGSSGRYVLGRPGLFLAIVSLLFMASVTHGIELDDVYRMSGSFRVCVEDGLRVYFPEACNPVMPRILSTLRRVRDRVMARYADQGRFEVSVILIDHDDREGSFSDPKFDTITISLTEEIGALSTRGYSFEDRFALRLSNLLILRALGPAKIALKRRLGILSMPPWFLEGLALYNAFPLDALHVSRLYDMARSNRLYSMDDLSLINSRDDLVREEMSFQAHALMLFLHNRSRPDAGYRLLKRIAQKPIRFDELFRQEFGLTLKEAFREFSSFVQAECRRHECRDRKAAPSAGDFGGGRFYQGLRHSRADGAWVWVSSANRREETYDLWRLPPGAKGARGNARTILRNVHPSLLVDQKSGAIYIGRYFVNDLRQRRLELWCVPLKGKPFPFVREAGSFRPLVIEDGRLWYLNITRGMTIVKSVALEEPSTPRIEFEFPPYLRPLDVAVDAGRGELLYVLQDGIHRQLVSIPLPAAGETKAGVPRLPTARILHSADGMIRYPMVWGSDILFCAEVENRTLQLHRIAGGASEAVRLTQIPGGVWDYTLGPDGLPIVVTLQDGGFRPVLADLTAPLTDLGTATTSMFDNRSFTASSTACPPSVSEQVQSVPYKPEYRSSFWLPKISRDDQGAVFGIYSYRADRLDRDRIEFSPTYGFKSREWGYTGGYQHRFGLFRVNTAVEDRIVRKSYLSNSYYERVRSQDFSFSYPFSLSTSITAGVNLTHRGIAEYPDKGEVPSVGRDHSLYGIMYHRAIRTEPFWQIFPRKGREVTASWRRGTSMAAGELIYDSFGVRWNEFVPLGCTNWVATLRGWFAEDDKQDEIRRPDDLNLGGSDFLRGYSGSVRYGDSLRAASIHLGRTIPLSFPWLRAWIQKEIVVGEAFWEMGDVRTQGREFRYLYDHGFEVRSRWLLLRRIPLTFRAGVAWPHDGGMRHSYVAFDITTLSGLVQ
ncbi:MAG TPA: hypothetical protein VIV61_05875 [Candidatus Ozemobacteraceae bacterium]